jgi:glycogen debranching enzyme
MAGASVYEQIVDANRATILDILRRIAEGYLRGTPNGIRVDPDSGLVWSPTHFTWMDTNYPAGTPREGYPVEIQVLWIRLLRQLAAVDIANSPRWQAIADRAQNAFLERFWLEERGYLADALLAPAGATAAQATPDTALRSNYLLAVAFGLISGPRARRCVNAALRSLVVPGGLRSLAPLPASPPLAIRAPDGRLLNNPEEPYWGRYEGDEDTRRKPAYHNGTAWVWTFPIFCEALAAAWDQQPEAVAAAKAYLSSVDLLLMDGGLGQLPEILDGNAPHTQRGCDAQAWSVTEALRVWRKLS